jgi:hypothetical protein
LRPGKTAKYFCVVFNRWFAKVKIFVGSDQLEGVAFRGESGPGQPMLYRTAREDGVGGDGHAMPLLKGPFHQTTRLRARLRERSQGGEDFLVEAINRRHEGLRLDPDLGEKGLIEGLTERAPRIAIGEHLPRALHQGGQQKLRGDIGREKARQGLKIGLQEGVHLDVE